MIRPKSKSCSNCVHINRHSGIIEKPKELRSFLHLPLSHIHQRDTRELFTSGAPDEARGFVSGARDTSLTSHNQVGHSVLSPNVHRGDTTIKVLNFKTTNRNSVKYIKLIKVGTLLVSPTHVFSCKISPPLSRSPPVHRTGHRFCRVEVTSRRFRNGKREKYPSFLYYYQFTLIRPTSYQFIETFTLYVYKYRILLGTSLCVHSKHTKPYSFVLVRSLLYLPLTENDYLLYSIGFHFRVIYPNILRDRKLIDTILF